MGVGLQMHFNDNGGGGGTPSPAPAPSPGPAPSPAPAPAPSPSPAAVKPNPLLEGNIDDVPVEWREHARELRRENAALRERTKKVDEAESQAKIDDAVKKAVDAEAKKNKEALDASNAATSKRIINAEVRATAIALGIQGR